MPKQTATAKTATPNAATPKVAAPQGEPVYQIKVTMEYIEPLIWRRLVVPLTTTLVKLSVPKLIMPPPEWPLEPSPASGKTGDRAAFDRDDAKEFAAASGG